MIELKQVTKQYGQAAVLKNITLSIDEPGIYCLLGRNGAGKTTLLKSVAGYQNITSGTIQVDDSGSKISFGTIPQCDLQQQCVDWLFYVSTHRKPRRNSDYLPLYVRRQISA